MASEDDRVRVIMWTCPRTISTALTKCLSHIEGIEIWFEPYCFCIMAAMEYRRVYGSELPTAYEGHEEAFAKAAQLISKMAVTPEGIIDPKRLAFEGVKSRLEKSNIKYVFVKDMTLAMAEPKYRRYLPNGYRHAFLIRRPAPVIASYRKATIESFIASGYLSEESRDERTFDIEKDNFLFDAGLFHQQLYESWKHVLEACDSANRTVQSNSPDEPRRKRSCVPVIDSDDLLSKPDAVLQKFCRVIGLPYSQSLLKWDASPEVAYTWKAAGDDLLRYNEHFYRRALRSTQFVPPKARDTDEDDVTEDVRRLCLRAQPFYDEMYACKLE
ncbi:uncharacterized protein [Diadema antillarum]